MWLCLIALNLEIHTGNIPGMLPSSVAPCIFIDSCNWNVFKARLERSFFLLCNNWNNYFFLLCINQQQRLLLASSVGCRVCYQIRDWTIVSEGGQRSYAYHSSMLYITPLGCHTSAAVLLLVMIRKNVVPQARISFWEMQRTMLNYCLKVRVHGSAWSSKIWLAHNMMELMCQETWKVCYWLSNIESRVQVLFCLMWHAYICIIMCVLDCVINCICMKLTAAVYALVHLQFGRVFPTSDFILLLIFFTLFIFSMISFGYLVRYICIPTLARISRKGFVGPIGCSPE